MRTSIGHLICLLLCISRVAAASEGGMTIIAAWSRATAPGAPAAVVYMRLANQSNLTVTLESIETPIAAWARIHRSVSREGVVKMTPIDKLSLAPGERLEFEPGGLHVMLMELRHPLVEGETFPITVTFSRHPDLHIEVLVGAMGQMKVP